MRKTLIGGATDLGVDKDGARLGPITIFKEINGNKKIISSKEIEKSKEKTDLRKNFDDLMEFNTNLYNTIKNENNFCIMVGGDHSTSIASSLASTSKEDVGIIWIDAHLDYNTFETTITGNLHGLPLATINGLNSELSTFHEGNYINPKKTVVIGYRSLESNAMQEINNIKNMGVTVFTTNDIKKYGIKNVFDSALKMIGDTKLHISFDLDVIDPIIAPGVSVPEKDGINLLEVDEIIKYLDSIKKKINSFDLVEYNPLNDKDNKTLDIALNILKKVIKF